MGPVLVILGPTAVGKTALALRVADEAGCAYEIVNADALQVYRGFDIGTAKPTMEERRAVPHHLIDILDSSERFSAGEFARRARAAIGDIEARGGRAMVVGGSGLYLRALLEGISPMPPGDPEVRSRLRERRAAEGLSVLYEELRAGDPETAGRVAPRDSQRVLRALEVLAVTGRPLSRWIASQPFGESRLPAVRVGLTLPRTILYDRISDRVSRMIDCGWVNEVVTLLRGGASPGHPAFQAIGYRQIARHVQGGCTLEQAIDETITATRRFAKRQWTWFRKEADIFWLDARDLDERMSDISDHLSRRRLWRRDGQAQH
ncbi:MAG: tRNA (adenosine(37)-N6)-dimethylallyltransferase MiaA [Acidobacteriota bacterium]